MKDQIDEVLRLNLERASAKQGGFRLTAGDKSREARFRRTQSPVRVCMACHHSKPLDQFRARHSDCDACIPEPPRRAASIAEATRMEAEGVEIYDPFDIGKEKIT